MSPDLDGSMHLNLLERRQYLKDRIRELREFVRLDVEKLGDALDELERTEDDIERRTPSFGKN